jgi:DNA-binding transcriptional LysR family regulator
MEFHQLRDFVAVASTGNFSQAASKCRVAQPSLSKAVQRLEAEFGEKLFIRSKRRTMLTPAGEVLYRHALRIINEVDQAKREMAETNGLRRGSVKIGVLPTISPYLLPRVLAQFAQNFPTLEVVVVEDRTADLLKLLDGGDLDLALASLPIPKNGFEKEILFQEELLLGCAFKTPACDSGESRNEGLGNSTFYFDEGGPLPRRPGADILPQEQSASSNRFGNIAD